MDVGLNVSHYSCCQINKRFHITCVYSVIHHLRRKIRWEQNRGTRGAAECVTDVLSTFEQTRGNLESICFNESRSYMHSCSWWRHFCVYPSIDHKWEPIKLHVEFSLEFKRRCQLLFLFQRMISSTIRLIQYCRSEPFSKYTLNRDKGLTKWVMGALNCEAHQKVGKTNDKKWMDQSECMTHRQDSYAIRHAKSVTHSVDFAV